ncbi:hypothetical protein Tco_0284853 [Tanacetum coccineum]
MSNSNTNLQTQSSNALHNAIMEAGSKDRPPMLAPGNYVQWKSRIKRYIDTKPNRELIHYSLQNPPYIYQWAEKTVPVAEGSSETTIERYMEIPIRNVSQASRDQMNAEAEAVQIILTGIDNDIYSTVDACPNACEMWKAIERPATLSESMTEMSKEKEIDKLMALISLSQLCAWGWENLLVSPVVAKVWDSVYINYASDYGHMYPMGMSNKDPRHNNVVEMQNKLLKDDTDDESKEQKRNWKAHYMYLAQLQEVTPDSVDTSGPIFDDEPMHKDDQDEADDLDHEQWFACFFNSVKLKCEL